MKITLPAETVSVDEKAWAAEYKIPVENVKHDVIQYFEGYCQYQITECLGLHEQARPGKPIELSVPAQVVKFDLAEWVKLSGMPEEQLIPYLLDKLKKAAQIQMDVIYELMTDSPVPNIQLNLFAAHPVSGEMGSRQTDD